MRFGHLRNYLGVTHVEKVPLSWFREERNSFSETSRGQRANASSKLILVGVSEKKCGLFMPRTLLKRRQFTHTSPGTRGLSTCSLPSEQEWGEGRLVLSFLRGAVGT